MTESNTSISNTIDCDELDEYLPADQQPSGFTIATSAPGKIILFGEHSVVYGKLALAASLGLRTKLKLVEFDSNRTGPNMLKINLQALNIVHSYDLSNIEGLLNKPLPLLKSASNFNLEKPELIDHAGLLELVGKFVADNSGSHQLNLYQRLALTSFFYLFAGIFGSVNVRLKPFLLSVNTDLTMSAGMGSSGSYLVTVAAAFLQYVRCKSLGHPGNVSKPDYKPLNVVVHEVNTFDKKDLDLISKWAQNAENIIHGSASGIDSTICTFGSMIEFCKGSTPKLHDIRHRFRVLLVNTMVPRETKRLVTKVASSRERFPAIINHVLSAMNEVAKEALECLLNINKHGSDVAVTSELQRDYKTLADLSELNQNLLCALQVSHPKLDQVCSRLREAGLSGKLTGAGGGGYAIAIVPPDFDDKTLAALVNDLNKQNFQAIVTSIGGSGVAVDSCT